VRHDHVDYAVFDLEHDPSGPPQRVIYDAPAATTAAEEGGGASG
jgi:hypothetical protein